MLKRTNKNFVNNFLKNQNNWKILDIGCGYTANNFATVLADAQDLKSFYKNKNFIQIKEKKLPFNDKEFDFVIASHVIEHVEDLDFFIKELERISSKGYIELPTRLGDNFVFENEKDHVWWFVFDDIKHKIIASKKNQLVAPFMTVATAKLFENIFRESFVMELEWNDKIDYIIDENLKMSNFDKISFYSLIKKFFSKKIRSIIK